MTIHELIEQSNENPDILTIEATVITGFEFLALDECREKCHPLNLAKAKGRIFFNIAASDFKKVLTLRSVDNILLVVETVKQITFQGEKENDLHVIKDLVDVVDWDKALNKWANISGYKGDMFPNKKRLASIEGEQNELVSAIEGHKTVSLGEEKNTNGNNIDYEVTTKENITDLSNVIIQNPEERIESVEKNRDGNDSLDSNVPPETNCVSDENKKSDLNITLTYAEQSHQPSSTTPELGKEVAIESYHNEKTPDDNMTNKVCCESMHNNDLGSECNENTFESGNKFSVSVAANNDVFVMNVPNEEMNTLLNKPKDNVGEGVDSCGTSHQDTSKTNVTSIKRKKVYEKRQPRGRNRQFGHCKNGTQGGIKSPRGNTTKNIKPYVDDGILKFRATCYRVGEKHSFNSMEAACEFGGTLQDKFGWTVDLTRFDLNIVLNIEYKHGYICLAITQQSLHRRNITHFSSTTLRATMCYNLLRLAEPMTGEIVLDPLCGGGSISIEGALSFPNTYNICGDYNEKAIERTRANISHINRTQKEIKVGPLLWNVKHLPLKPQSVDVLVTDLPFGKRSGSKQDNQRLYNKVLYELAKVVRMGTGRACLMTYDKTSLIRALKFQASYWREIRQFGVNQGGLFSTVVLLLRKAITINDDSSSESNDLSVQNKHNLITSSHSTTPNNNNTPTDENVQTSTSQEDISLLEEEKHVIGTEEPGLENNQPSSVNNSNQSTLALEN